MKRLKDLRQARNYTQQQIAEMLKTTQEAVDGWECGQQEPDIQALRDLAVIYGTSVEDLLHANPLSDEGSTVHPAYSLRGEIKDGFWGHIGLRMVAARKSTWYPITYSTWQRVMQDLPAAGECDWLCIPTLNNRFLVARPSELLQVHLLDEACDEPPEDWELDWDSWGLPLEVYRGLHQYVTDDGALLATASETFSQMITDIATEQDRPEDSIERSVLLTRIHTTSGEVWEYEAQETALWELVDDAQTEAMPVMVSLPEFEAPSYRYYSTLRLSLIDAPLLAVMAGAEEVNRALSAEED